MTRRSPTIVLPLLAALTLAACGDDPKPAGIEFSPATLSFDAVGDTATLTATVFDDEGNEMEGRSVEWSTDDATVATVTAEGRVTSTGSGNTAILATAGGASNTVTVSVVPGVTEFAAISPSSQVGVAGEALAPLVVEARDRLGNPAAGVELTTRVDAGGGSLSAASVTTDAQGRAQVVWTLGPVAGDPQQMRFLSTTGPGRAAIFFAQSEPGPVAEVVAEDGEGQVGLVGSVLPTAVQVRVTDRLGNPRSDETLDFTVVTGGGAVSAAQVQTDSLGRAQVTWTLGAAEGEQRLLASTAGVDREFVATALSEPAGLVVVQGASVEGEVASTVADPLVVRLEDQGGTGISGIPVRFTAAAGSGLLAATPGGETGTEVLVTTGANGEAVLGSWILGEGAGTQTVEASFPGLPAVGFTANALPGAPISAEIVSGDYQVGEIFLPLPTDVVVQVEDQFANPVPGVGVSLSVGEGGGSLSATQVSTDAQGRAATSWTLGALVGLQTVTAAVSGLDLLQVNAAGVLPSPGEYTVEVDFLTEAEPYVWAAFQTAANRWSQIIVEDAPDVDADVGVNTCGSGSPAVTDVVDDLRIFVRVEEIDGAGSVLGSAGPCWIRTTSPSGGAYDQIPFLGRMRLDEADLENQFQQGTLSDLILHEIGHVLGIGVLWDNLGYLQNPSLPDNNGVDTHFNGPAAIAAFDNAGGSSYQGAKVPVENTRGGSGTQDSHWRESVLTIELMTGFISRLQNPLSAITAASLEDLGYVVDLDAADAFTRSPAARGLPREELIPLGDDILRLPLRRAPIRNR